MGHINTNLSIDQSSFYDKVVVGMLVIRKQLSLTIVPIHQLEPVLRDRQRRNNMVLHLVYPLVGLVQLRLDVRAFLYRGTNSPTVRHNIGLRVQEDLLHVMIGVHPHNYLQTLVGFRYLVQHIPQLILLLYGLLVGGSEVGGDQEEALGGEGKSSVIVDVQFGRPLLAGLRDVLPKHLRTVDDKTILILDVGVAFQLLPHN